VVRDLLLVIALVVALRVPFLTQPIQGDDIYYLAGAQYAQTDPLHPHRASYLFQGRLVSMQGHPHPPLNAFVLAGLVAVVGDVKEVPFHAAYALFSVLAAVGMYFLARRFVTRPLVATLLFCAVPAFVVNGNSFESDLPFLAFWMLSMAAMVEAIERESMAWLGIAMVPLGLAGLAAYQSVVAIPILWLLVARRKPTWWAAYAVAMTPAVVLVCYQVFEATGGKAPPLAVTAGYFKEYGLQQLGPKLRNAKALVGHLGWMVFPAVTLAAFASKWVLLAVVWAAIDWNPLYLVGVAAALGVLTQETRKYGWWPHVWFAASLALFFAGSARYLLPMAAPVVMMVVDRLEQRPRWLYAGVVANLVLGLGLAWANYQHWAGYRDFVAAHEAEIKGARVWVNGEFARFYAENLGALPLERGQAIRPGEMVLTSELGFPFAVTAGGGQLVEVARKDIVTSLPLRLIGLGSKSGYSDASAGVRPFDVVATPVDRLRLERVIERKPTLSYVPMGAPEAEQHILSGAYQLEDGKSRWMGKQARLILQPKAPVNEVSATVYVPPMAKAKKIWVEWNGARVAVLDVPKDGLYTVSAKGVNTGMEQGVLTVECDVTFSAAGDTRELGVVLIEAGLK
jgi:hypothetical protein